jgi:hypothetical protein
MSYYPNQLASYATRVDNVDYVIANDVNALFAEIYAIQSIIGTNPHSRTSAWNVGNFSTATTTWTSLSDRITNIENGIYIIDCGGAI